MVSLVLLLSNRITVLVKLLRSKVVESRCKYSKSSPSVLSQPLSPLQCNSTLSDTLDKWTQTSSWNQAQIASTYVSSKIKS